MFQILMSAKLQIPASILIPAKTLLGVSSALVGRGSKAMAGKTEQVAFLAEKSAHPRVSLLQYVSI